MSNSPSERVRLWSATVVLTYISAVQQLHKRHLPVVSMVDMLFAKI